MDGLALFRLDTALIAALIIVVVDVYIFRALRSVLHHTSRTVRLTGYTVHWTIMATAIAAALWYYIADPLNFYSITREWIVGIFATVYLSKITALGILLLDDLRRLAHRMRKALQPHTVASTGVPIPRSEFLTKSAVIAASVPLTALTMGIISGAHDYRVIRRNIYLPKLPKAFDGLRIGQISDIHAGTLFHRTAVQGGVDLLMAEKPDLIFFTGDLVNYYSREIKPYIALFSRLRAPLGVYSITGNHDYGDYVWWPSAEAKQENFQLLQAAHREMGYQLLLNESRMIAVSKEPLAILGTENWNLRRNQKYGDVARALQGAHDTDLRLLLAHDPTHWDVVVRKQYPMIDVTFSGHTHGYQCGVEVEGLHWSPAQYRYRQWADLYQEGQQYVYVNRGFGCIGYPGRLGMAPELTVLTLRTGDPPQA
jgi:predicted MPP superfamily phosphohydrolase